MAENDVPSKTISNGQFKLIKKIGEGSFGQVFLAVDTLRDNMQVAVKTESL